MPIDWGQLDWPAGTPVYVHDIYNRYIGVGTLVNAYVDADEDGEIPEIRLADGRIIMGYDCLWIPVAETERKNDDV